MSDQGFGQGGQGQNPANQGGQTPPEAEATQATGQPVQPAGNQGMMGGAEQAVTGQVDQEIEQLAGKIPGGQQFAPQVQQAAGGLIDNLGQQVEHQIEEKLGGMGGIGGMLGGLFGGHGEQGNQGNQGNQGS